MGQELSGEIEATGKAVTRFKAGDQVFAFTGFALGAYAEYTCLPEGGLLAIKPANMTYEEAAAIPLGGLEAADFLRRANIRSGQKVLIIGAGGSIGTLGVQLAKYFGAEVTAVDSPGKLDMLRVIGADHVIDYTRQDFTKSGESYDVIFDVIGKSSYSGSLRLLKKNGCYLQGNPSLTNRVRGRWTSLVSSKKILFATTNRNADDLIYLKERIEAGQLRPVIDRRYPLEQIVEAHRYVETGAKKGCVVITV